MDLWLYDLYCDVLTEHSNIKILRVLNPHLYNTPKNHKTMIIKENDNLKGISIQDFIDKIADDLKSK